MANTCCDDIKADLTAVKAEADAYSPGTAPQYPLKYPLPEFMEFLTGLGNLPPAFIRQPTTQDEVPTLAELLQRIRQPFTVGFSRWQWYNDDQPGKTTLVLPDAPSSKVRVQLNSAGLAAPRDYSIAGTVLTFVHPLAVGDLVTVIGYGG